MCIDTIKGVLSRPSLRTNSVGVEEELVSIQSGNRSMNLLPFSLFVSSLLFDLGTALHGLSSGLAWSLKVTFLNLSLSSLVEYVGGLLQFSKAFHHSILTVKFGFDNASLVLNLKLCIGALRLWLGFIALTVIIVIIVIVKIGVRRRVLGFIR